LSKQAVALLQELGYPNVRDYRGGLADWVESGRPLESVSGEISPSGQGTHPIGPQLIASPDGHLGRGPARVSRESGWNDSVLGLVDRLSTFQLFLFWIGTVALSGFGYWTAAPAW